MSDILVFLVSFLAGSALVILPQLHLRHGRGSGTYPNPAIIFRGRER